MKRYLWFIVIAMVCLSLNGCSLSRSKETQQASTSQNKTTKKDTSAKSTQVTVDHVQSKIPKLTAEFALNLGRSANTKYDAITLAGEGIPNCKLVNDGKPYTYNDEDYWYFCDKIDTMSKFHAYLADVFTNHTIRKVVDYYHIIEVNGKLLMSGDAGGSLDWTDTEVLSVNQDAKSAEVEFKLTGDTGYFKESIHFKFVDGDGWRIDDDPSKVY